MPITDEERASLAAQMRSKILKDAAKERSKKAPAKKKKARKRKKPTLTLEQRKERAATLERNKLSNRHHANKAAKKRTEINKLSLAEQVAKQQLATKVAESVADSQPIAEILKEQNYDPVKQLIALAQHPEAKIADKISINKAFINKIHGDVKSIDIQGKIDSTVNIQIQSFADATEVAMKAIHEQAVELSDEDYEEFEPEVSE